MRYNRSLIYKYSMNLSVRISSLRKKQYKKKREKTVENSCLLGLKTRAIRLGATYINSVSCLSKNYQHRVSN